MLKDNEKIKKISFCGFSLLAVLLVFFLYQPGLHGSLHFDDEANLRGLERVTDWQSALNFSLGGWNLFGRSLSLASFAAQAHDWNNSLENLLWVNVVIHAVNTFLVGCLAYSMARLYPLLRFRASWVALGVALIWGLASIHVSASLMLVQRMTTLSASFQLLGLLAFVIGRGCYERRKSLAIFLIFFAMPLFSLLALLAKENGALVPVFCLVVEFCWLRQVCAPLSGRVKKALNFFLLSPLLIFVVYLGWVTWFADDLYATRAFTLSERLLTQSRILFEYVRDLFFPRAVYFSPFADDYPVSQGILEPLSTALSLLFWVGLLLLCVWLRRYTVWPFFGLMWFFMGHLLESTVVPLELFFHHRNYLPVFGLVFAFVALLVSIQDKARARIAAFAVTVYIGLSGFVLWSTTSLWGDPLLASTLWLDRHPYSERAILYAAQRQVLVGERQAAYKILEQGARKNPGILGVNMSYLQFVCLEKRRGEIEEALNGVMLHVSSAPYSNASIIALDKILDFVVNKECPGLSLEKIESLVAAMEKNPRFEKHMQGRASLAQIKARALVNMGRKEDAIQSLQQGLTYYPITTSLLDLANLLYEQEGANAAIELLLAWRENPPTQGISADEWRTSIDQQLARFQLAKKIGLEFERPDP